MISLIKAASGNTYLVIHTKYCDHFIVKGRVNIVNIDAASNMNIGYKVQFNTGFGSNFEIIKSYETMEEALEDNFVDLI